MTQISYPSFNLLFLFFCFLFSLFFLTRLVFKKIYRFFLFLTRNIYLSKIIPACLFLPGTFLHEISHFLAATLLFIPTGKLTIIPTIEEEGKTIMGKMEIKEADPWRLSLVGLAPLLVGLVSLFSVNKYLLDLKNLSLSSFFSPSKFLGIYLVFTISNTMFSSRKDLKGLLIAGPITLLVMISLYLSGINFLSEGVLIEQLRTFLEELNLSLFFAVIINLFFLIFLEISFYLFSAIPQKQSIQNHRLNFKFYVPRKKPKCKN